MSKKKILLLGNGVNRLSKDYSWKDLLEELVEKVGKRNAVKFIKEKPFALLYEEVALRTMKFQNRKEIELKKIISTLVKKIKPNEFHKKFLEIDGNQILTTNYDYKHGTEHTVGTSSQHGSVDCTTTYQTPLPLVVVDNGYIEIPDGFDESTKISSTCPDWMDESQNLEATSMKYLSNVTITDSDNQVSHISTYNEL
jgi:hypothetical protein